MREAKRIVVKRSGLARIGFAWTESQRSVFGKQSEAEARISHGRAAWVLACVEYLLFIILVLYNSTGTEVMEMAGVCEVQPK